MDAVSNPQVYRIPGPVLLCTLTILALNTILDPGLPANRIAWDRASPFTCAYQCVQRLVELSHSRRSTVFFCFGTASSKPLLCLNMVAVAAFGLLVLCVKDAPYIKAFAGVYLASWVLSHLETVSQHDESGSNIGHVRNNDHENDVRKRVDWVFAFLVHSSACFATFCNFRSALVWTLSGLAIYLAAARFSPGMPVPPANAYRLGRFGLLLTHWYVFCLGIFIGHGPGAVSMQYNTKAGFNFAEDVEKKLDYQSSTVLIFNAAVVQFLLCQRDSRRLSHWGDFLFAFVVLATGVLWFGWIHEMYWIFGPFPAASVSVPL